VLLGRTLWWSEHASQAAVALDVSAVDTSRVDDEDASAEVAVNCAARHDDWVCCEKGDVVLVAFCDRGSRWETLVGAADGRGLWDVVC